MKPNRGVGEDDLEDRLRDLGLVGGLALWSLPFPLVEPPPRAPKRPLLTGVAAPDVESPALFTRGRRASEAALRSKLVVPNALVDPERAEHTMATLWLSM